MFNSSFPEKNAFTDIDAARRTVKNFPLCINLDNACEGGNIEVVKLFIENGANDWHKGFDCAGDIEMLKLLIKHSGGKHINIGLSRACLRGHMDIVKFLIKNGANDFNGGLSDACLGGHMDIVKLMIDHGADDFDDGLWASCEEGHIEIAKLMIKYGASDRGQLEHVNCLGLYIPKSSKPKIYMDSYYTLDDVEIDELDENKIKAYCYALAPYYYCVNIAEISSKHNNGISIVYKYVKDYLMFYTMIFMVHKFADGVDRVIDGTGLINIYKDVDIKQIKEIKEKLSHKIVDFQEKCIQAEAEKNLVEITCKCNICVSDKNTISEIRSLKSNSSNTYNFFPNSSIS